MNYKDLKIWQRSRELVSELYVATKKFPKEEQYGLTSQIRRAAISIPSNIAEGYSRRSSKELKRYLDIATGSCFEIETQILIATDLGYLDNICGSQLLEEILVITKMIRKFRSQVKTN